MHLFVQAKGLDELMWANFLRFASIIFFTAKDFSRLIFKLTIFGCRIIYRFRANWSKNNFYIESILRAVFLSF